MSGPFRIHYNRIPSPQESYSETVSAILFKSSPTTGTTGSTLSPGQRNPPLYPMGRQRSLVSELDPILSPPEILCHPRTRMIPRFPNEAQHQIYPSITAWHRSPTNWDNPFILLLLLLCLSPPPLHQVTRPPHVRKTTPPLPPHNCRIPTERPPLKPHLRPRQQKE